MKLQPEAPDNFTYVLFSLDIMSTVISEMEFLYKGRSDSFEFNILNNQIFKTYNMTLMYTFIMEYCKLLELKDAKRGGNNHASLQKLNYKIKSCLQNYPEFDKTNNVITSLRESTFHQKLRTLRDTQFAHTDRSSMTPSHTFNIRGFTTEELDIMKEHFTIMCGVLNKCASPFDRWYDISLVSSDAEFFLKEYAEYEKYYTEHYKPDWLS
jgi:hypothetical protein